MTPLDHAKCARDSYRAPEYFVPKEYLYDTVFDTDAFRDQLNSFGYLVGLAHGVFVGGYFKGISIPYIHLGVLDEGM